MTPEQKEHLKHAAAFAYGYNLAIYMYTLTPEYLQRAKGLKKDLKSFGCLDEKGHVTGEYFQSRLRGLYAAEFELGKI